MRWPLIAAVLMALFVGQDCPAASAQAEDWTSCQADAECVVVGSICPNFYWAVHRDYVFANAAHNAELRGSADCAPSFQPRPQHATCQQGHCHIPPNQAVSSQNAPQ